MQSRILWLVLMQLKHLLFACSFRVVMSGNVWHWSLQWVPSQKKHFMGADCVINELVVDLYLMFWIREGFGAYSFPLFLLPCLIATYRSSVASSPFKRVQRYSSSAGFGASSWLYRSCCSVQYSCQNPRCYHRTVRPTFNSEIFQSVHVRLASKV